MSNQFQINLELIYISIVSVIWEVAELILYFQKVDDDLLSLFEITRTYILLIISGLAPIIYSFKQENMCINTFLTTESISNFDLMLMSERPYYNFMKYIREEQIEGLKLLNFWTVSNVFKYNSSQNHTILASEIYEKFLKEDSINYINFRPDLIEEFVECYQKIEQNRYSLILDNMKNIVYTQLRDFYFPKYKMSRCYKVFKQEIRQEELIYSRLIASDMMSNSELII